MSYNGSLRKAIAAEKARIRALSALEKAALEARQQGEDLGSLPALVAQKREKIGAMSRAEYRRVARYKRLPQDMKCMNCNRGPLVSRQFQLMDDGRALCLPCARIERHGSDLKRIEAAIVANKAAPIVNEEYSYED